MQIASMYPFDTTLPYKHGFSPLLRAQEDLGAPAGPCALPDRLLELVEGEHLACNEAHDQHMGLADCLISCRWPTTAVSCVDNVEHVACIPLHCTVTSLVRSGMAEYPLALLTAPYPIAAAACWRVDWAHADAALPQPQHQHAHLTPHRQMVAVRPSTHLTAASSRGPSAAAVPSPAASCSPPRPAPAASCSSHRSLGG